MCRDSISALQTRALVPADASTGARHGVWSETSKEDKVFQRYVYVIDCDLLLVLVVGLCSLSPHPPLVIGYFCSSSFACAISQSIFNEKVDSDHV